MDNKGKKSDSTTSSESRSRNDRESSPKKLEKDSQAASIGPEVNMISRAAIPIVGGIPPWSSYAEEAHVMITKLREEKEREVKKVRDEWQKRSEQREKEFVATSQLTSEHLNATLKDVEMLFVKASCNPVCQQQQDAVMQCYQEYPKKSLQCAQHVQQFSQCVDRSRLIRA